MAHEDDAKHHLAVVKGAFESTGGTLPPVSRGIIDAAYIEAKTDPDENSDLILKLEEARNGDSGD